MFLQNDARKCTIKQQITNKKQRIWKPLPCNIASKIYERKRSKHSEHLINVLLLLATMVRNSRKKYLHTTKKIFSKTFFNKYSKNGHTFNTLKNVKGNRISYRTDCIQFYHVSCCCLTTALLINTPGFHQKIK